jgi:hypothetical protein
MPEAPAAKVSASSEAAAATTTSAHPYLLAVYRSFVILYTV